MNFLQFFLKQEDNFNGLLLLGQTAGLVKIGQFKSMTNEPLAKVSEKDFEKSFPEELESIGYRFLNLSSFRSLLDDGFLSTGHIDLPLSTFFFAV